MMLRRQIYLTEYEVREIQILSECLNISISEYIRRVLDEHITSNKKKSKKK